MDLSKIAEFIIPINLVITIWLAFKQVNIDDKNLRLNLYEKRYCIYESTINFLNDFLCGSLSSGFQDIIPDLMVEFKKNVHQSIFLFDSEVEKYLLEILNTTETVYTKKIREKDYIQEIEWLEKQKIEARKIFKPYMRFKK